MIIYRERLAGMRRSTLTILRANGRVPVRTAVLSGRRTRCTILAEHHAALRGGGRFRDAEGTAWLVDPLYGDLGGRAVSRDSRPEVSYQLTEDELDAICDGE